MLKCRSGGPVSYTHLDVYKRQDLELVEGQLSSLETARKNEEIRLSQAKAQLEMLQKERSEKQEIATNIRVELRHNQEFVALEEEKKELKRLQDKRQEAISFEMLVECL